MLGIVWASDRNKGYEWHHLCFSTSISPSSPLPPPCWWVLLGVPAGLPVTSGHKPLTGWSRRGIDFHPFQTATKYPKNWSRGAIFTISRLKNGAETTSLILNQRNIEAARAADWSRTLLQTPVPGPFVPLYSHRSDKEYSSLLSWNKTSLKEQS